MIVSLARSAEVNVNFELLLYASALKMIFLYYNFTVINFKLNLFYFCVWKEQGNGRGNLLPTDPYREARSEISARFRTDQIIAIWRRI